MLTAPFDLAYDRSCFTHPHLCSQHWLPVDAPQQWSWQLLSPSASASASGFEWPRDPAESEFAPWLLRSLRGHMARHNTQAAAARLRRGASQESTPPSSGNVSPSHSATAAPPSASKRAGISHLHLRRHKRDIMRDMWRRVWRLKDAGGQAKVTLFLFLAFALWLLFFFGAPKELPDLARHPAQAHGANRSAQTAASAAATLMNATAALGIAARLAANYSLTAPPRVRVQALRSYPHDPRAFTQGLLIHRGQMWESTGLYGQSELRRVSLDSGGVQQRWRMDGSYFAEGLCVWNDKLVQLTWQNRVGFIYDTANFTGGPSDRFSYDTEGWGVTSDGSSLIISDGSSTLYFHDPQVRSQTPVAWQHKGWSSREKTAHWHARLRADAHPARDWFCFPFPFRQTFAVQRRVTVRTFRKSVAHSASFKQRLLDAQLHDETDVPCDFCCCCWFSVSPFPLSLCSSGQLHPVTMLNELELIDGYVYANVWMTTRIAVIEPATGVVVAWLDAAHLHPQPSNREMTLNGIAFDEDTRKLYVTGKLWPTLFEIQPYTPR